MIHVTLITLWLSGSSKLRGIDTSAAGGPAVSPGACVAYPAALVVEVAEAVGDAGGGFHGSVGGFGTSVRNSGLEEP